MSLILSIETATPICSIALHHAGILIAHTAIATARSHATCLMVMIEDLLKISQKSRQELVALAISSGPGSYTGLRIGATIAKGLCYGLDLVLIAIATLEAMVHGMASFVDDDTLLCPTIDAGRQAVYTLMADNSGYIQRPAHVALLDSLAYRDSLPSQPLLFFGDGTTKCKQFLVNHPNIRFIDGIVPSAIQIGSLAYARFQQKYREDIASYQPIYLSQFQ